MARDISEQVFKLPKKSSDPANRGKSAEKVIHGLLDKFSDNVAGFCANRVPDAHMAGGRFPAQAGDFQAFRKITLNAQAIDLGAGGILCSDNLKPLEFSRNFIIEVKEVKHDFRLPSKNYDAAKVARVQKRVWAGTEAVVAVLHTTTGLWRLVPFEVFTVRAPSWDLSAYEPVDIEQALGKFLGVIA